MDSNNATLNELIDIGGWSISPKFHGQSFIWTDIGLFKRNPYSSETYRIITPREWLGELSFYDAPEVVKRLFNYGYFSGNYSALLSQIVRTAEFHVKRMTRSRIGSMEMNRTAVAQELVKIAKSLVGWEDKDEAFLKVRSPNSVIETRSEAYKTISSAQNQEFLSQLRVRAGGPSGTNPDAHLLDLTYNPTFAVDCGSTDYKDHRNDSPEFLKKMAIRDLKTHRMMQLGLYLNEDGTWIRDMVVFGFRGGWHGQGISKASFFARWR